MSTSLFAQWQHDSKYGFKINIPSNWNKKSYTDGTDKVYDYMSADENLAIQLRAFEAGAGFTTELLAQVYEESMMPEGTQKLSLDNYTTANGISCKRGAYLLNYNGTEIGLSALYIVEDNKGYVITALIPTNMVKQRGEELKQITKSFSIDGFVAPKHTEKAKPSGLGGLTGSVTSNSFKINSIKLCEKVDANNNAVNPTNTFNTQTSEILAVVTYTGGTQKDMVVTWIFNNRNRTISSDIFNFTDKKGGIGIISITKPNAGWPVGRYSVKFEMNGKVLRELSFTVNEQSTNNNIFSGSTSNENQITISSHQAYNFKTGAVESLAASTGGGFAIFSNCDTKPEVGGKFIVTNSSNFISTTSWDKTSLANTGSWDRIVVPLNKVCIFELRDGSYAKFMFTKSDYNSNGCTHTLTCLVEYPISKNSNNSNSGNNKINGKYNLIGRSDGKSLVDYHFIDLKSDGKYWEEYSPKDSGGYVSENAGTWKVVGNQLTLTQRYGGVSDSYTITGNELKRTSSDGTIFTFKK